MEAMGLMPSHTGQPGGRKLGQKMADYVMPGGLFETVCKELLASGFRFNFQSVEGLTLPPAAILAEGEEGERESQPKKPRQSKVKYSCPCGQNAWGKPGLAILCAKCGVPFA